MSSEVVLTKRNEREEERHTTVAVAVNNAINNNDDDNYNNGTETSTSSIKRRKIDTEISNTFQSTTTTTTSSSVVNNDVVRPSPHTCHVIGIPNPAAQPYSIAASSLFSGCGRITNALITTYLVDLSWLVLTAPMLLECDKVVVVHNHTQPFVGPANFTFHRPSFSTYQLVFCCLFGCCLGFISLFSHN